MQLGSTALRPDQSDDLSSAECARNACLYYSRYCCQPACRWAMLRGHGDAADLVALPVIQGTTIQDKMPPVSVLIKCIAAAAGQLWQVEDCSQEITCIAASHGVRLMIWRQSAMHQLLRLHDLHQLRWVMPHAGLHSRPCQSNGWTVSLLCAIRPAGLCQDCDAGRQHMCGFQLLYIVLTTPLVCLHADLVCLLSRATHRSMPCRCGRYRPIWICKSCFGPYLQQGSLESCSRGCWVHGDTSHVRCLPWHASLHASFVRRAGVQLVSLCMAPDSWADGERPSERSRVQVGWWIKP